MWRVSNKQHNEIVFSKSNPLLIFENKTDSIIAFLSFKIKNKFDLFDISSTRTISSFYLKKMSSLSYFDNPLSMRPSSVIENSFTVPSNPKLINLMGDKESVSSMKAIRTPELLYRLLDEAFRPLTYHDKLEKNTSRRLYCSVFAIWWTLYINTETSKYYRLSSGSKICKFLHSGFLGPLSNLRNRYWLETNDLSISTCENTKINNKDN